jgi:UBX domain-containing protein 1
VTAFYAEMEDEAADDNATAVEPEYTGPRTLDGRPAPQSGYENRSSTKKPAKKKGLATLSSLGSGHDHDHDHDDDDDDEDDEDYPGKRPRDLFAGGEKSGLAVHDPAQAETGAKKIINDIIAKAKE